MFKLERLELFRLQIDLSNLFKIIQHFSTRNIYNVLNFNRASHNIRGHHYKLFPCRAIIRSVLNTFFNNRIINVSNSLYNNCFNTNLIKCFKSKQIKIDFSRFIHSQQ